jgi:hypothetical protein
MSLNNHSSSSGGGALLCCCSEYMLVNSALLPLFELSGFRRDADAVNHARLIFVFGRTWNEEYLFRCFGELLCLMKANERAIVLQLRDTQKS